MKVCDVYGTTKGVEAYRLQVTKVEVPGDGIDKTVDLCPRALKRLARFIDRGTRASSCRGLCAP